MNKLLGVMQEKQNQLQNNNSHYHF